MTPAEQKALTRALAKQAPANWSWVPPAVSGRQTDGTSFLPFGRYEMPDGSKQASFGLPKPLLDMWRGIRYATGQEQDPAAAPGHVTHDKLNKAGAGGAEFAAVGHLPLTVPAALAAGLAGGRKGAALFADDAAQGGGQGLGTFAGRLSKTADHEALRRAEVSDAAGKSREEIWQDTGWFKGVDGKWRYEIDDSNAKFPGQPPSRSAMPLQYYLLHKELADAYPDAWRKMKIQTDNTYNLMGVDAGATPNKITMRNYDGDMDTARSHALHEVQHAIPQHIEGFAQGGVPEGGIAGNLRYLRQAGEVEARAVEARKNMTPEERKATPPWQSYDTPEDRHIVTMPNGTLAASPLMFPLPESDNLSPELVKALRNGELA